MLFRSRILRDAPEYKRIFCIQDHHQQFIRSLKKKIIGIGEIFVAQESVTGGGSDRRILLFDVSKALQAFHFWKLFPNRIPRSEFRVRGAR